MVKHIQPTDNSFDANGRKYIIHSALTIERFEHFEDLEVQIGLGVTFEQLHGKAKEAYAALNSREGNLADASVILNDIIQGVARVRNGRQIPTLLLCTLFICREGEDRSKYDRAEAVEKINDWRKEGYSVADFFSLAFNLVSGLKTALNENSPLTSDLILEEMMNQPIPPIPPDGEPTKPE